MNKKILLFFLLATLMAGCSSKTVSVAPTTTNKLSAVSSANKIANDTCDTRPSHATINKEDVLNNPILSGSINPGETKTTEFTPSKNSAVVTFSLGSPTYELELHVYDKGGRHVGLNDKTNKVDLEIPGATLVGGFGKSPLNIQIPNNSEGAYLIKVVGPSTIYSAEPFQLDARENTSHPPIIGFAGKVSFISDDLKMHSLNGTSLMELGYQKGTTFSLSWTDLQGPSGTIPSSAISIDPIKGEITSGGTVGIKMIYTGTIPVEGEYKGCLTAVAGDDAKTSTPIIVYNIPNQ